MALARRHDVRILPVDSEHNALFQLLEGRDPATIRTYTLTASGGPFRTWPAERIAQGHARRRRSPTRPGRWAPRSPSIPPRS